MYRKLKELPKRKKKGSMNAINDNDEKTDRKWTDTKPVERIH